MPRLDMRSPAPTSHAPTEQALLRLLVAWMNEIRPLGGLPLLTEEDVQAAFRAQLQAVTHAPAREGA